MHLNFRCPSCDSDIQAAYQHIGEWVVCPVCNFSQVVPDPQLPPGSSYCGYSIERLFDASFLWYGYMAVGSGFIHSTRELSLMRIPSSFFLRNVTDLNAFSSALVRHGSAGVPGLAALIDKSLLQGRLFFVYEVPRDMCPLSTFINVFGPLHPDEALGLLENVSCSMSAAWRQFGAPHLGLSPASFMLTPQLEFRIFDYGVSTQLLPDPQLDAAAFNIWDPRYMSPEARAGIPEMDTPSADIFSLGAIAYLLLAGVDAFDNDLLSRGDTFPELPGLRVSSRFRDLLRKMTAHAPADRFSSWDELSLALSSIRFSVTGHGRSTQIVTTRSSKDLEEEHGRFANVGLTHQGIKMSRKLKLHSAASHGNYQGTDTIAKLSSPSKEGKLNPVKSLPPKKGWTSREILLAVVVVSLVFFMILLTIGAVVVFHGKSAQRKTDAKTNAVGAVKCQVAQVPLPVKEPAHEQPKPFDYTGLTSRFFTMVKEADDFSTNHPDAMDEALELYDKASAAAFDAKDSRAVNIIRARIDALLDKRGALLDAVMKKLDGEARPFLDAGDLEAAKRVYLDYAGSFKAESKDRRVAVASKISRDFEASSVDAKCAELEANARRLVSEGRFRAAIASLDSYNGPLAAETAAARKRLSSALRAELKASAEILSPLVRKLAPFLLASDVAKAHEELSEAMKDSFFSSVKPHLERIDQSLKTFASFEPDFLDHLKRNVGKPIYMKLNDSTASSFSVVDVIGSSASVKVAGKQRQIAFKDLSATSKLAFAGKRCKLEDEPLVVALLALQSRDAEALKAVLPQLPFGFDTLLSAGLKDQDAKAAFERLLDASGLPYSKSSYESVLKSPNVKSLSKDAAMKLNSELSAFLAKFPESSFVTDNRSTIDELAGLCLKAGASSSDSLEIDLHYLMEHKLSLNEAIDKAPAGAILLKAGAYKGGVLIGRDSVSLTCEPGAEIDGGLKITGSKVSVSNLVCVKGSLDVASASDVKLEACAFLGQPSVIKTSKSLSFENCLFKGLSVLGVKDLVLNHCTSVGAGSLEGKVNAGLLILSGELSATNCLFSSEGYGVVVAAKLASRKIQITGSLLHGNLGACTELTEGGGVSKNVAKTEVAVNRYLKGSKLLLGEPKFSSPQEGDYTLDSGSPGLAYGTDGRDCGILLRFSISKSSGG